MPEPGYRGQRRLPRFPGKRYAQVILTAAVGASMVTLGAVAVDDLVAEGDPGGIHDAVVADRLDAVDRANRSQQRLGRAASANQGAPDIWLMPLRASFQITSLYEVRWGTFHFGLDMASAEGSPIYASHAGTVKLARFNGGYGLNVQIDNGLGILTIFGHASALLVKEGQRVEAGQAIALVGSTGYSTGPHLHYEITIDGKEVDPMAFMKARGVDILNRQETATGGTVVP